MALSIGGKVPKAKVPKGAADRGDSHALEGIPIAARSTPNYWD